MAFTSAPAFADEGDDSLRGNLQGAAPTDALELNKTNSLNVEGPVIEGANFASFGYKFTLSSEGKLVIPSLIGGKDHEATSVTITNAEDSSYVYQSFLDSYSYVNHNFYLAGGTYYLSLMMPYDKATGAYSFDLRVNFTPDTEAGNVTVLRLYNPYSGEHLFTKDKKEYNSLKIAGWRQEGESCTQPSTSGIPVYRLYNKYSGDHHYTTNKTEYSTLGKGGWNQEGIAWYSDESKGKAVYRLYNPYVTVGTHHYTTNEKEYSDLAKGGWKQESVGWYGLK